MSNHQSHQMKLTSLLCRFPSYDETQFNGKFRQKVENWIIKKHLEHPEGLTDNDLFDLWEKETGNKPSVNLIRPRRNDLSNDKRSKVTGEILRPSFLYDSGELKIKQVTRMDGKEVNISLTVWKMNENNLYSYLQ